MAAEEQHVYGVGGGMRRPVFRDVWSGEEFRAVQNAVADVNLSPCDGRVLTLVA